MAIDFAKCTMCFKKLYRIFTFMVTAHAGFVTLVVTRVEENREGEMKLKIAAPLIAALVDLLLEIEYIM